MVLIKYTGTGMKQYCSCVEYLLKMSMHFSQNYRFNFGSSYYGNGSLKLVAMFISLFKSKKFNFFCKGKLACNRECCIVRFTKTFLTLCKQWKNRELVIGVFPNLSGLSHCLDNKPLERQKRKKLFY